MGVMHLLYLNQDMFRDKHKQQGQKPVNISQNKQQQNRLEYTLMAL